MENIAQSIRGLSTNWKLIPIISAGNFSLHIQNGIWSPQVGNKAARA